MNHRAIQRVLISACLLLIGHSVVAEQRDALAAFPAAQQGMTRFVIRLPEKSRGDEDALQVELIAGRETLTDGVNLLRLASAIDAQLLPGWGYTYYAVSGSSEIISTRMAPPPNAPQVKQFVSGAPLHIRYNSRLPIVVYAPQGYQVRYRIWSAAATTAVADEGY
jgi:ecotin